MIQVHHFYSYDRTSRVLSTLRLTHHSFFVEMGTMYINAIDYTNVEHALIRYKNTISRVSYAAGEIHPCSPSLIFMASIPNMYFLTFTFVPHIFHQHQLKILKETQTQFHKFVFLHYR